MSEKSGGWVARVLVPLVILGVCVAGTVALVNSKPEAKEKEPELFVQSVRVAKVSEREHPRVLQAPGLVMPSRTVALSAPVSAELRWVAPDLGPGARVAKGDVLFKLDRAELAIAVERAQNAVSQAEQREAIERGQRVTAQKEWESYAKTFPEAERPSTPSELALRGPQLKLAQLEKARAGVDLDRAKLDLRRATIKAPFDGMVRVVSAARGQRVSPGAPLVEIVDTKEYWVEASVPLDKLDLVAAGASKAGVIQANTPAKPATFVRLIGEVDPITRMGRVLFSVSDPVKVAGDELLVGARVLVVVESKEPVKGVAVPRRSLYEDTFVWVLDAEERLERRDVSVLWRRDDDVIVSGLSDGARLVTSPLSAPAPGAMLRVIDEVGDVE